MIRVNLRQLQRIFLPFAHVTLRISYAYMIE